MSDTEDALRTVLEHPGELATRLAYARVLDARHDPLGEFIRLECELAQRSCDGDDTMGLWDRRLSLLEAHGKSWVAPLAGIAESTHFDRGLIGWVLLDLDTYLTHGAEIFGRFPVRWLAIRGVHGRMAELLESPWVDRIEYLSLSEPRTISAQPRGASPPPYEGLSDDDVAELAASDRLRNLRGIDLGWNRQLGPRSVDLLLTSPWCDQLELLDFGWTSTGDEGASLIASTDRLDNLRRLDLSNTGIGPVGARALADSRTLARLGLTELDFSLNHDIDQEGNGRLLRSPVLARVGTVNLDGSVDAELVDAFVHSDSLGSMKKLKFGDSWTIDTASLRRLARWPGLAGLDCLTFVLSGLSDEQLEILATSPWLGNLKSLLLSETRVTDDGVERFCRSPAWRGLEELGIDRNSLTERSVRAILAAGWFPQLRTLDLHASYTVSDAGAVALASYRGPTRLRRLILSLAGLGDAGALALLEAPFTSQLWTLWLLGNKAISPTTSDLLSIRLGGRVHTDRAENRETWRNHPERRSFDGDHFFPAD
ncbi:MAG: hypothetical protein NVSMB9_33910 [Isosphaeraceae bacterium]